MTVFVDTTIWASGIDSSDALHEDGSSVMNALATGELSSAVTTDYVLDETLTLLKRRGGNDSSNSQQARSIVEAVRRIASSPAVTVLYVDRELFEAALSTYRKYGRLSFTDAVTLTVMQRRKIKEIFSHDSDFDLKGIIRKERPQSDRTFLHAAGSVLR
ncbi:MAG: PIN domain-containing protein [Nitrososphaerales archaeon]